MRSVPFRILLNCGYPDMLLIGTWAVSHVALADYHYVGKHIE